MQNVWIRICTIRFQVDTNTTSDRDFDKVVNTDTNKFLKPKHEHKYPHMIEYLVYEYAHIDVDTRMDICIGIVIGKFFEIYGWIISLDDN